MSYKVYLVFIFAILGFLVSACGGGGSNSSTANNTNIVEEPSDNQSTSNSPNENETIDSNTTTPETSTPETSTPETSTVDIYEYPFIAEGAAIKNDGSIWQYHYTETEMNQYANKSTDNIGIWQSDMSTFVKKADGRVMQFGTIINDPEQFGFFNSLVTVNSTDPIYLSSDFIHFSFSETNWFGLKSDKTLWGYGMNQSGALGLGHENEVYEFTLIGSDFIDVASGSFFTIALKSDYSVWGWGENDNGELANATTATSSSVPVKIAEGFIKVVAGRDFALALKNNGDLYGWGGNYYGQLGLGISSEYIDSVIKIETGIKKIFVSTDTVYAIKEDNSLWVWGMNFGAFGNGSEEHSFTPIKVGENYLHIATGAISSNNNTYVLALKTDGTLWKWGELGQLSPVQVGSNVKTTK